MTNYNKEQFIKKNSLNFIDDYLLKLNNKCSIDKNGVHIKHNGKDLFFTFDPVASFTPFKLQKGLWDKIRDLRDQDCLDIYLRVDLSSPAIYPGMIKLSTLMFGLQVSGE